MKRITAGILSGLLLATIVSAAMASSSFGASYAFDPVLSLTGNCAVSESDPVPDPGCPGGSHPPARITTPTAIATDDFGDIYVASFGADSAEGAQGRIDIFDSSGHYLTEIADPLGPRSLAVDSDGNLYVFQHHLATVRIDRYSPTTYNPAAGEIAYGPPETIANVPNFVMGMAVNPVNDHLFVHLGTHVDEFDSAAGENKLLDSTIGGGFEQLHNPDGYGLAVDAQRGLLYVSDILPAGSRVIRVFELAAPHNLLRTMNGAEVPAGRFISEPGVAVNETTGELFAFVNNENDAQVLRFDENGKYLGAIGKVIKWVFASQIAVDNGPSSPNRGHLYVPNAAPSQIYAFGQSDTQAPEVEGTSVGEVTADEAELIARINPGGLNTNYTFEYTTRSAFLANGFLGAQNAGGGQIPAGSIGVDVAVPVSGLEPGTEYVFRVLATNEEGPAEGQGAFATYPPNPSGPCANDPLRSPTSAGLPDCRAYELVTPGNTNARTPAGVGHLGTYFVTREASPGGDRVSFIIEGGLLPGSNGTGSLGGDPYLSSRGADGWTTAQAGPTGSEAVALIPGSTSPDQGYSFWSTGGGEGSAAINRAQTEYVRYPDGHSALVGRGSLRNDPQADGKLISEGGSHIIFVSATAPGHEPVPLEPKSPPAGTSAIYDRTADEVTHVISLLPGNVTPASGQNARYLGASLDGRGVAFSIGPKLYLRYENKETFEIGEGAAFAGIAEGGGRIFYVQGGNLKAFDVATLKVVPFSTSGNVTPVNVSADGTAAYFVSPSVLTSKANPLGAKAKAGEENLYLSREGALSFVGTVTDRDVEGDTSGGTPVEGLGLWMMGATTGFQTAGGAQGNAGQFAADPSRTTPNGNTVVFESRANLTAYDSEGTNQLYRYDQASNRLQCLSCNPTGAAPSGFASLQSISEGRGDPEPFSAFGFVNNLRSDGRRAIFQSTEALVAGDTDRLQDVYEWEDQGVGSCTRAGGCVYLISSGHSARTDYLYAVSDSGDDVFFRSADLLLAADGDETPSIYDARVGGGFPEAPAEADCQGEGCRPGLAPAPAFPVAGTAALSGKHHHRRCPKGKRKVKRHGKVRCVKKHRRHRHKASGARNGAGK